MPLYYITGIAGSGKSTVLVELRNRGYEAYDVDESGPVTAKWYNDKTGFIHPKSSIKKEDRTSEFLAEHSWKVPRDEVVGLARRTGLKTVFLGGSIANETDIQDLFDSIFALTIDNDALKHRLADRTANDWGKNPHELEYTLAINRELDDRYEKFGYIIIDASKATTSIADEILSHINGD